MSPTAHTLAHLWQLGCLPARFEVYLQAVRRHRDPFGAGDRVGRPPARQRRP